MRGGDPKYGRYHQQGEPWHPQQSRSSIMRGGSSPPPQPSAQEQASAQMELERQRARLQEQREARERQRAKEEKYLEQARMLRESRKARRTYMGYGGQLASQSGYDRGLLDKYGVIGGYQSRIPQPSAYKSFSFDPSSAFEAAVSQGTSAYRSDLGRQLESIAPEDFSYNLFGDSADDEVLQAILDSRKSDAQAQIDAAHKRGQLSDVGYNRALGKFDEQGQAAWSDLQDLGLGVLSGYRDQLDALRKDELGKISAADLRNPVSFDAWQSRLKQTEDDLSGRLSGDLYRAVEGQSFFDPMDIISSSGALQGYYNPTVSAPSRTKRALGVRSPLLDEFIADEEKKKRKSARGEEGNGVF